MLSFLIFVPHFGLFLGRVLEGWALLCMVALLSPTLGVGHVGGARPRRWRLAGHAGAVPGAGGAVGVGGSRLWSLATGHDTYLTARDILSGAPFIPLEQQERHA